MPRLILSRFFLALLGAALWSFAAPPALAQDGRPVLVFGAASLTETLQEIGVRYQAAHGQGVLFSFAGSMALARQIEASSGADIFIAADSESMDYLDQRGLIARETRRKLLGNTLVLIAPADSPAAIAIGPGFALAATLGNGRLALADTAAVPAGRYARTALMALGAWDSVASRLAEAEDVRAALALVARGETPLGVVYATDARVEPRVRIAGAFPSSSHPPIVYPAALTKDARPSATGFLEYLGSAEARAVFERAGFQFLGTQQNP